jgi:hypothetical protein
MFIFFTVKDLQPGIYYANLSVQAQQIIQKY